jgi:hypothetical protein
MLPDEVTQSEDVTVTLAVALKQKVWSSSVRYPGKSTARNCGILQTGLTAHSGLAIALIVAMKTVNAPQIKVLIVTQDAAFAGACELLTTGKRVTGLRSARSLFLPLKKALARGRIEMQVVTGADNRILSIRNWGVNSLTPVKQDSVSLRIFTPQRITESQRI